MNDNNENINTNESTEIDNACTSIISQVESFTKPAFLDTNTTSSKSLVVKIPVVLADINIIFSLEANIILDRLAREIKRIKKNVFLTESSIIPLSRDDEPNTGIVFIKGFIRNNIEYIPQKYNAPINKDIYGNIRYCIVETPFELSTKITFIREPIFNKISNENEVEFCSYKISDNNTYLGKVIECNFCDKGLLFTENFNEKPFVELIRSDIIEIDFNKSSILKNIGDSEELFTNITEKSVVNLTIKVLQRQEVNISTL